ncbi:TRAP transporter large permease subunit [Chloroflexota bacterium]
MEWPLALLLVLGSLFVFMIAGLPVAFSFMVVNLIGAFLWWGGMPGLTHVAVSIMSSLTRFALLPLPLFILMGEVIAHSGIAPRMIDALDKWLGRLPGRLGLLAVGSGAVFSTLTGVSMASIAMMGPVLVPEMEKRGYKKSMSLGPIVGSGGIAVMIPPSALAVLLGAIAEISIGRILMGIILPGVLIAIFHASYIIIRCALQPSIAPAYEIPPIPVSEKLIASARYILPIGLVIFLVIGLIFLGVATPSEAAATGAIGTFILAAMYGKLNWGVVKKSIMGSAQIAIMILIIIGGATAFSQILLFSGATKGLIELLAGLTVHPIFILITMQIIVLVMGTFMELSSIMMVTLPIFMPIVHALGFNEVWFAVLMMLNMEMGATTPPFGLNLFVMKNVATPDTTMEDVYKAALPFIGLDLILMAIIIAFPAIALWLPSIMIR